MVVMTFVDEAARPSMVSLPSTATVPPVGGNVMLSVFAASTGADTVKFSAAFAHTAGATALHNW